MAPHPQVPNKDALALTEALMADEKNRLCGLGPRDSLRLEAGLCLYGNDLEQHLTPVEAGLTWTIGKSRREDWTMLGGEVLKQQVADGVKQRRVGFVTTGAPSRQGCEITDLDGNKVRTRLSLSLPTLLWVWSVMSCLAERPHTAGADRRDQLWRLQPQPGQEHRHGLRGQAFRQGGDGAQGGGAWQGERRHRHQDAVRARNLLQGLDIQPPSLRGCERPVQNIRVDTARVRGRAMDALAWHNLSTQRSETGRMRRVF